MQLTVRPNPSAYDELLDTTRTEASPEDSERQSPQGTSEPMLLTVRPNPSPSVELSDTTTSAAASKNGEGHSPQELPCGSTSDQTLSDHDDPTGIALAQDTEDATEGGRSSAKLVKVGLLVALVAVILCVVFAFDARARAEEFLEWLEDHQEAGAFAFAAVYAVCTVLFIPGSVLSIGAGAVFGLWLGALVVFVGASIGQAAAFLLARYLLREAVEGRLARSGKWRAVDAALGREGWKLILLLRLAPLVPYNALNYLLGLSAVQFKHYAATSMMGIIPGVFLFVYLGSVPAPTLRTIHARRPSSLPTFCH